MNNVSKPIFIASILIAFFVTILITNKIRLQFDFTEDRHYSLSDASREIVNSVDEPLLLRFYFSRSLDEVPVLLKNFATTVEDLLDQFDAINSNITVEVIDPRPDTELEDQAIRAGIYGARLQTGNKLYFGLEAILADQTAIISNFTQQRERFLEYDIAELIYKTRQIEQPVLGVITSLPMFANQSLMRGRPPQKTDWFVISELKNTYKIRHITGNTIPDDVSVLIVIHPNQLNSALNYRIDQFLLSGKPVLVAVDPSGFIPRSLNLDPMIGVSKGDTGSSNFSKLFNAYGIEFSSRDVVGDIDNARMLPWGKDETLIKYPFFIGISDFNEELSSSASLSEVWMMEPGSVSLRADSDLKFTSLINTSLNSGLISNVKFSEMTPDKAEANTREFVTDHTSRSIAAMITGNFTTAFPEGKPVSIGSPENNSTDDSIQETDHDSIKPESLATIESLNQGSSTLVVIADTDFLADSLIGEPVNYFGVSSLKLYNDNLALFKNLVDQLAGNPDLISLRGKGSLTRPFELIDSIRSDAQLEFQSEIEGLEEELAMLEQQIRDIDENQSNEGLLIVTSEARNAVENYRDRETEIRKQIREIRKQMREEIEGWKIGLAAFNIALVPMFITIFGILYFVRRNKRSA